MTKAYNSIDEYLNSLSEDNRNVINNIRRVIGNNLPEGFKEVISYGMIGYVVPHPIYPNGYRCDPKLPLPFINLAMQKNFIALYHMGIYADQSLLDWFKSEYPKYCKTKLDMGKSCIRFKNINDIPYELIGKLVSKISVTKWIELYETQFKIRN